jgi:hypothetical protein
MAEFFNAYLDANPQAAPNGDGLGRTLQLPEMSRAHPGGAIRIVNGQAEAEQFGGVTKLNTYTDALAPGGSIMATVRRDANGTSVETRPGDPSSRTLIQSAVREGFVRETGPGTYADNVEALAGPSDAPEVAQQDNDEGDPADPGFGVFDPNEDAIWAENIEPIPQAIYDASIARSIGAVLTEDNLDAVGQELAKSAGMAPALAAEFVGAGYEVHRRIADRELGKLGLFDGELDAAYAWMRETKGPALRHCLQQFVMGRDITPLRKLAGEFQAERKRKA